MNCHKWNDVE